MANPSRATVGHQSSVPRAQAVRRTRCKSPVETTPVPFFSIEVTHCPVARHHGPDANSVRLAGSRHGIDDCSASRAVQATIRPMPMLNVAKHLVAATLPRVLKQLEERRHRPRAALDLARRSPSGRTRGRFSVMPPPVMCAIPLTSPRSSSGRIDAADTSGAARAARRPTVAPSSGTTCRASQPGDVEDDAARERVAVGVQARRGQADQHVARRDRSAVDQLRSRSTTPTMKPARSYSPSA